VIAAQGKVRQAELNLSYTTIRSPVTGLSSRAKKQEGSYIAVGPESLLTYVAKVDPIWVTFSVSENEFLKLQEGVKLGLVKLPRGITTRLRWFSPTGPSSRKRVSLPSPNRPSARKRAHFLCAPPFPILGVCRS